MKESIYNIVVEKEDKFIYFNTLTTVSMCLNKKEHESIQNALKNIELFKNEFPNIFKKFCDVGFIIENERNEKEEVLFNKKQGVFLDREYRLFINPTLDCNFNCWYCYEEHPKEKMNEKIFERIKKHIEIKSKDISGLHLSWFGGEPLMYFDEIVYPLSMYSKQLMQNKQLTFQNSITTNAYFIDKYMIEKMKQIDLSLFQITLDGNKIKHDKVRKHYGQPSFDKICNNIVDLCSNIEKTNVILRINYDEQTLKYGLDFLNQFPKDIRYKINIDFQRVWQTYSEKQINSLNELLLQSTEYVIQLGYFATFWRLYKNQSSACYADKYCHLEINYDGKIYKCTAKGYKPEFEVGILNEDGTVELDYGHESKHFCKLTVENELCLPCKYLPLCGGMCWQNNKNMDQLHCVQTQYEIPMETAIIKNYEYKNAYYEIYKKRKNNY